MATTSPVAASSSAGTLDVPSLVSQLMSIERRPIDTLNTQVSNDQAKISSLGTIQSLISSFQTAMQSLSTGLQGFSATSSNTGIFSASANSTAAAGSYSLAVTNLASAQNLVSIGQASSTTAISNGVATTVTFDFGTTSGTTFTSNGSGTKSITIDGTNNTLQGIASAINSANMGVTATIVNDGSGTPYRLSLASSSGASNSLKITASGGDGTVNTLLAYDPAGTKNLTQTSAAQNANFSVNGIAISKASNTVTDAIQGVTLTLSGLTSTPATLTIAHDTNAISTAASGFVDAYNALQGQLTSRSAYGTPTSPAGTLAGDGAVRAIQDQLRGIFMAPATGGTLSYLSQVGIAFQANGTLQLDSTKLNSAMANNFSDVTNLFSGATGFATRLGAWATSTIAPGVGLLATRTNSLNSAITAYNNKIGQLEIRMTALQAQYTTQYTNLNMLLTSMNSTSNYITQQLTK